MTRERAAGYTRLSQQGKSLPEQRESIEAFCRDRDLELVEVYSDGQDASGYTTDREAYQALLERLQAGDVGHVVVRDRSRLSRDAKERLRLLLNLDAVGVEVHAVETGETVDLDEAYALTREAAQADADDVEKRKEAERGKAEADRRARAGLPNGRPPLGLAYARDGDELVRGDRWQDAIDVIDAREEGKSWRAVEEATGVSKETARRLYQRREEYEALRDRDDDVLEDGATAG